jgi:hypothetical protein
MVFTIAHLSALSKSLDALFSKKNRLTPKNAEAETKPEGANEERKRVSSIGQPLSVGLEQHLFWGNEVQNDLTFRKKMLYWYVAG